ncbi:MAG TPA: hypothetical protein DHU55_05755 [Blastocatellia bacterium]|nr:hypothetical protein [Blastocatellia bacterium]
MSAKDHVFTLGIEEEFQIIDPETLERGHLQRLNPSNSSRSRSRSRFGFRTGPWYSRAECDLPIASRDASTVRVRYLNQIYAVPLSSTDCAERFLTR